MQYIFLCVSVCVKVSTGAFLTSVTNILYGESSQVKYNIPHPFKGIKKKGQQRRSLLEDGHTRCRCSIYSIQQTEAAVGKL